MYLPYLDNGLSSLSSKAPYPPAELAISPVTFPVKAPIPKPSNAPIAVPIPGAIVVPNAAPIFPATKPPPRAPIAVPPIAEFVIAEFTAVLCT